MSLHLATTPEQDVSDGDHSRTTSSDEDEDDQNWDDWVSDSVPSKTYSLFENRQFASVAEALQYDKSTYGFDLNETCSRLCSSFHNLSTVPCC